MIQFEYLPFGATYSTKLEDICYWLQDRGYAVGKLYPDGVAFYDEAKVTDFFGPNMVAVSKTSNEYQTLVSSKKRRSRKLA